MKAPQVFDDKTASTNVLKQLIIALFLTTILFSLVSFLTIETKSADWFVIIFFDKFLVFWLA